MENAFGQPQSVVVLGGTSDIARALIKRLCAARTRTVVLAGRDEERLAAAAAEARGYGASTTETVVFDAEDLAGAGACVATPSPRPATPWTWSWSRWGARGPGGRRGRRPSARRRWPRSTSPGRRRRWPRCADAWWPRAAGASWCSRGRLRCACGATPTSTGLQGGPRPAMPGPGRVPRRNRREPADRAARLRALQDDDRARRTPFASGSTRSPTTVIRGMATGEPVIWSPPLLRYVFDRAAPPAHAAVAQRGRAQLARGRRRGRGARRVRRTQRHREEVAVPPRVK